MKSQTVDVVIPASTSNLGSGFDTLGIALRLYNTVRITQKKAKGVNLISPVAEAEWPRVTRMLYEAYRSFFAKARKASFGVDVEISGAIPAERGLGASATLRLGMVAGLNVLAKKRFDRQMVLDLVAELEGHPDNAAPAVFGGFSASGKVKESIRCIRHEVSSRASFVTLIPRTGVSTDSARELVPHSFNKLDVIHGLNRSALIAAAFSNENLEQLRGVFDDRIHQPHREPLVPQLSKVIQAGERAGAIGGWLSGAGSGIICLTLQKAEAVAKAMQRQLPDSEVMILKADNDGFTIKQ